MIVRSEVSFLGWYFSDFYN